MKSFLLLFLYLSVTILAVWVNDYVTANQVNRKDLDIFSVFLPGVLFSFFVIALYNKLLPVKKSLLFFFVLSTGYLINLLIGLATWGLAVPFGGGSGALLIRWLFEEKKGIKDKQSKRFILLGFLAGIVGLICGGIINKLFPSPEGRNGLLAIVFVWQLAVAVKIIKS